MDLDFRENCCQINSDILFFSVLKKFHSYTPTFQQQLAFTQAVGIVGELHQSFLGL